MSEVSGLYQANRIHGVQRVLILGHTGYIGRRLYRFFREEAPEIEIVGHSLDTVDLTKGDEVDFLSDLFDLNTAVIVCAGIKKQYGDNLAIFLQNITMMTNVCRLLEAHPVRRVVYFSSAEVYGEETHDTNVTEETVVNPTSFYGIAKYACEGLFHKVIGGSGPATLLILRPALVYGPGEEGTFYGPSGFIRTVLKREPITLWGDGKELRDFIYIDDLVNAVVGLTFHEYGGIVNIVSGRSRSFKETLEIISNLISFEFEIRSRPRTKPNVDQVYNRKRLTEMMPGISFASLEEGIRRVLDAESRALGSNSSVER